MRIFLASKHSYPAKLGGPGGGRVFDCLAKGLVELGHELVYYMHAPPREPLPVGMIYTDKPCWDADIYHVRSDSPLIDELNRRQLPWVATCHVDPAIWQLPREMAEPNWIYVSQTLARTMDSERFVYNAIDPEELSYSENKKDYLLFVCTLRMAKQKGLEQAIEIAKASGRLLYVAGSDPRIELTEEIRRLVESAGMVFLNEISGTEKARWFAEAAAFLFPNQINEAFGLVMAEAMMSGTPVVCSDSGACPEIVTPDVGFVCREQDDYLQALQRLDEISPQVCRQRAMEKFHYRQMAKAYVREYEKELLVLNQTGNLSGLGARSEGKAGLSHFLCPVEEEHSGSI